MRHSPLSFTHDHNLGDGKHVHIAGPSQVLRQTIYNFLGICKNKPTKIVWVWSQKYSTPLLQVQNVKYQ